MILQTIRRTHRHMRTIRSIPASTGPGRARWPRLRETEQIQDELRRLQQPRRSAR